DHTPRNAAEERQHLPAPQSLAQNRRTLRVNAVDLKNMLGQIQTNCRNLAHGWLLFLVIVRKHQFGTSMPQGGHPPHHSITSSARASSVGGTSRPNIIAVAKLITSSNLLACTIGKSAGFAPFSMRPE